MWQILETTQKLIACLKAHKQSHDEQEVRDLLQKFLQILKTAQEQVEQQTEIKQSIELVYQALTELDIGIFWLEPQEHTVELSQFSIPENSPLREFFEACQKAA